MRPVPRGAMVSLGVFLRAGNCLREIGCLWARGRSRRGLGRTLGSSRMGTRTEMDGSGRHRGPSGRSEVNGSLFPFRCDASSDSFVLETQNNRAGRRHVSSLDWGSLAWSSGMSYSSSSVGRRTPGAAVLSDGA